MSTRSKIFLILFSTAMVSLLGATVLYKYSGRIGDIINPRVLYKTITINKAISLYPNGVYGIDISHYQKTIDWDNITIEGSTKPIDFVFIRATVGRDKKDKLFSKNWNKIRRKDHLRGAYHYYNPNHNSTLQAENFIQSVKLKKGDFPPILDIERLSKIQSKENLILGIKNWLKLVEEHYEVKPIIYTGKCFYQHHLINQGFDNYPLWIASYSSTISGGIDWEFWQFSETGKVKGINHSVDLNVFNGTKEALKAHTIQ